MLQHARTTLASLRTLRRYLSTSSSRPLVVDFEESFDDRDVRGDLIQDTIATQFARGLPPQDDTDDDVRAQGGPLPGYRKRFRPPHPEPDAWHIEGDFLSWHPNPTLSYTNLTERLDVARWFGDDVAGQVRKPVFLEVGSGQGEWAIQQAMAKADVNWIANENQWKRCAKIVTALRAWRDKLQTDGQEHALRNLKVAHADADTLVRALPDDEPVLDGVVVNFPDPQSKRRRARRRLTQPFFLTSLAKRLKPGAEFVLTTDHERYAHWSADVFRQLSHLYEPAVPAPPYVHDEVPASHGNIITAYEHALRAANRKVFHTRWRRRGPTST